MMKNKIINKTRLALLLTLLLLAIITSCKKEWLEAKADKKLVVPSTLTDFQGILDFNLMNHYVPSLGDMAADGYYTTDDNWPWLTDIEKNAYSWTNAYNPPEIGDWDWSYQQVLSCNIVLDGLKKVKISSTPEQESLNQVNGQALFHRAKNFYHLSQLFAPVYNPTAAKTDLSIPLRLTSDIAIASKRSTVEQTYQQMISDLMVAKDLLPTTPLYITRPSKPAAFSLLARIYLNMENYDSALVYSDKCLQIKNDLLDYNTLNPAGYGIGSNKEIIFHDIAIWYSLTAYTGFIDTSLYNQYTVNDLRSSNFFQVNSDGSTSFKGSYNTYDDATFQFGGIATDEIYLIRAECYARKGMTSAAMADLNKLLRTRWVANTFVDYVAINADDALKQILQERRKELIFRGVRWSDLRRLNKDDRFKTSLTRTIDGNTYTLEPNSYKYTFPIPAYVIQKTGMQQNPGWQ